MKSKNKILNEVKKNLNGYIFPGVIEAPVFKYDFTEAHRFFVTGQAFDYLNALDRTFVGTNSYMGFAYFWGQEYKHTLREANNTQRQRVHNALIKAGIDLGSESPEYEAIVKKYCKSVK